MFPQSECSGLKPNYEFLKVTIESMMMENMETFYNCLHISSLSVGISTTRLEQEIPITKSSRKSKKQGISFRRITEIFLREIAICLSIKLC